MVDEEAEDRRGAWVNRQLWKAVEASLAGAVECWGVDTVRGGRKCGFESPARASGVANAPKALLELFQRVGRRISRLSPTSEWEQYGSGLEASGAGKVAERGRRLKACTLDCLVGVGGGMGVGSVMCFCLSGSSTGEVQCSRNVRATVA